MTADATPGIEVRGVDKTYGAGPLGRQVVRDCSFIIEPGKFTVMIGPSGVGKSTLIRLIAGFEKPTRGEILVDGRPVLGPGRDRQVMFQESALFPWMTVQENVLYGPAARGELDSRARAHGDRLLEEVGLGGFRRKYPAQLSGGMQRRAELARAMINNPRFMLLDDPFRGLDAMTKKLMLESYAKLCQDSGRTNLFVTTDVDEAIYLADRVLIMSHIPTCVRATVDVELPRPRELSTVVRDDSANRLKISILSILHEEAMKAFTSGSLAAADFVDAYRRRTRTSPS